MEENENNHREVAKNAKEIIFFLRALCVFAVQMAAEAPKGALQGATRAKGTATVRVVYRAYTLRADHQAR